MHAATGTAWDEAAERYEGWLAEAIELIRGGGSNLFPEEEELLGDLHGTSRAIHLQCAGGRDTLSLWRLGVAEVVGVDLSPRMIDLAERLTAATGAPATWFVSDVLDTPHELDGTADLVYTGPRLAPLAPGPQRLGCGRRPAARPRRPARPVRRAPVRVARRRRRRRPLGPDRLRLFRRPRGVARLVARLHRPPLDPRRPAALEVLARLDPRRGSRHARTSSAARRRG